MALGKPPSARMRVPLRWVNLWRMQKEQCLNEMGLLWKNFTTVRGALPYLRETRIGKKRVTSPSYYRNKGIELAIEFSQPLDAMDIKNYNAMGYWVNQSFVIWLYALLEYHGLVESIDMANPNGEDVNLLRRLRMIFSHTNGRYDATNPDERRLFDAVINRYRPGTVDQERFNLQIDEVLERMYSGARKYVESQG
jgi:hypothetical protein